MIQKNSFYLIILISFFSCSTSNLIDNNKSQEKTFVKSEANQLISAVTYFNKTAPKTISCGFVIEAIIKNKKFKSNGKAVIDNESNLNNITLHDFVFKSHLFTFIEDSKKLYFYYPTEKQLIIDSVDSVIISDYADINIDYNIIKSISTHQIPLIKNYSVVQAVSDPSNNEKYLVIENESHFETIFFNENKPQKILIIGKLTKDKYEIHFNSFIILDDSGYFQKITILSVSKKIKIDITFNNIQINKPLTITSFKSLSFPKDVKIRVMER